MDEPKAVISEEGTATSDSDDWEEKDVVLKTWIYGTLSEETIYIIYCRLQNCPLGDVENIGGNLVYVDS